MTQVLPYPPDAGPKIKTFNLLRYLAREGHEVVLVSLIRSEAERMHQAQLAAYCRDVRMVLMRRSPAKDVFHLARSLFRSEPFLITRDYLGGFEAAVESAIADYRFDAVHVDQLNMAQYALNITHIPKVLDEHNAVWTIVQRMCDGEKPGPRKAVLRLETRKLKRYEGEACRRFDQVLAVTDEDAQALAQVGVDSRRITVIPIGVDCLEKPVIERRADACHIVSLGTMFYPPNAEGVLWFASEVFPLIKKRLPQTRFYVIGARPPREVQRLAERDENIVVTGYVPDPEPYLQEASALVVPLWSGGGMRVKILEAFARGIPVVSTPIGCEGIDATSGADILVADAPGDFAEAIIQLMQDRAFAQQLAENARRAAVEKYDWRVAYMPLREVYSRLTTSRLEEGLDIILPDMVNSIEGVTAGGRP